MFNYGDRVRVKTDITTPGGFFKAGRVVVPAGAVGRVVGIPLLSSKVEVTFAAGVGVFHDETIRMDNLEPVTADSLVTV